MCRSGFLNCYSSEMWTQENGREYLLDREDYKSWAPRRGKLAATDTEDNQGCAYV